jgi:hypothetical protein
MGAGNPQNTNLSKDIGDESQSTSLKKKVGKKVNSGSSKKMTAKEQSEQFIKTARELEVDESGQDFDKVIKKIINQ